MGLNLIALLKNYITPEVISKSSTFVSENENGTLKAIDNIIPVVLGGLLHKAQEENGIITISNLLIDGAHNGSVLNNVLNLFNGGEQTDNIIRGGSSAITVIFGQNKATEIANLVAAKSDVQISGANKLLNLITPLVLGLIGKQTANGDTNSIIALLADQKEFIITAAPEGLAGLLGLENLTDLGGTLVKTTFNTSTTGVTANTSTTTNTAENNDNKTGFITKLKNWALPFILIAGIFTAIIFGVKKCNKPVIVNKQEDTTIVTSTNTITVTGNLDTLTGEWIYDLGNTIAVKLPDSTTLQIGEFSTESKLIAFLNSNETVDTVNGNWFEFTNVQFKPGSSDIAIESISQLKNLASISKAYPNAQFKIGGYTDNTGSSSENVKLSQNRADAVVTQIIKFGALKSAIAGAKGYGQEWPVADNETPEGRAQNRRIAVNVKAK